MVITAELVEVEPAAPDENGIRWARFEKTGRHFIDGAEVNIAELTREQLDELGVPRHGE